MFFIKRQFSVFGSLKVLAIAACLAATSIVTGKYLAIPLGDVMRFSFENTPILFGAMAFGPFVGAAIGVVADLVGCVLVGYPINPAVTVGAAMIGLCSGLSNMLCRKAGLRVTPSVIISVVIAHLIGSVTIKTAGLAIYYDMPMLILALWRLINYLIVGAVECLILCYVMKNRQVRKLISRMSFTTTADKEKRQ